MVTSPKHALAQWGEYAAIQPPARTVGHVFQGRYKAIVVDKASYLLELARYIVLIPVRALMVRLLWIGPGVLLGNGGAAAASNSEPKARAS